MNIWIVRHGETEWNVKRKIQGRGNSPLTRTGRLQAQTNGQLLAKVSIDAIFASPAGRVRETLEHMKLECEKPVDFLDDLQEMNMGEWEGVVWEKVKDRWPEEFESFTADRRHNRPPGGECFKDVEARARAVYARISAVDINNAVIVSHGGTSRALMQVALSLSEDEINDARFLNSVVHCFDTASPKATVSHFVSGKGPVAGLHKRSQ